MQDDFPNEFEFEEEEGPLFPEEEEEEIEFGEEAPQPTQNRAFLIGVAVLAGLFIISLCAVLLIILTRPDPNLPVKQTNTAVMQLLATTQAADTQQAIDRMTQAAGATLTAQALLDAEATRQAVALTEQAEAAEALTLTAQWLTQSAQLVTTEAPLITDTPTPTPEEFITPVSVTPMTPGGPTPVPGPVTPAPRPLPDTGIADDLGLGGGLFAAGLAAIGLLTVMFVARRLRTGGYDEDEA